MAKRLLALLLLALACAAAAAPEVVFVRLGEQAFALEVALDPARRLRGLSGRGEIPRHEGLLFVLPRPQPFAMVMRDCPAPIDVAFLDAQGRVAAIHEMRVEPPRGAAESPAAYERRSSSMRRRARALRDRDRRRPAARGRALGRRPRELRPRRARRARALTRGSRGAPEPHSAGRGGAAPGDCQPRPGWARIGRAMAPGGSKTMRAYQLLDWQRAGFGEAPVAEPGPGQVRVRIGGAGLCHSDLLFLDAPPGRWPFVLPMTLGHENAGWIDRVGLGVERLAEGDAVLLETHWWCGRCEFCRRGADNYCARGFGRAHGVGAPGGLAAYLVTEAQQCVPLGALEPIDVAPLADAGRTSYHAVKRALPKLVPGSTAVVIGVGGLGGYAVQWLRALSPARVIAVDVHPGRLKAAEELGAEVVVRAGADAADALRDVTRGRAPRRSSTSSASMPRWSSPCAARGSWAPWPSSGPAAAPRASAGRVSRATARSGRRRAGRTRTCTRS
jgi:threonine dehydrogenase-like Zn-dependent dehydrogenase/uncharacterized membrane protein (UPF0127 family)